MEFVRTRGPPSLVGTIGYPLDCEVVDLIKKVDIIRLNTKKYHVFAPMGRFQLELIYLYFPPSFHLIVVVSVQ